MNQPIWVTGRVPNGYWSTRSNRAQYMKWLGKKLRVRSNKQWYKLSRKHFQDNYGGGLLATIYKDSPLAALQDYMPREKWIPWMFSRTPQAYWRNPKNRRAYMKWLGKELGYTKMSDWYALSQQDFRDHGGNGLLANYYRNSPVDAVREYMPTRNWNEWQFHATPQRFWQVKRNRARYMEWLGKQLKIRKPEDWYRVTRKDFYDHDGAVFLKNFRDSSPQEALRESLPKYQWKPWLFTRVPNGYWKSPKNRVAYVKWLGKMLGCTKNADWYVLTREDVKASGGGAMLSMYYNNSVLSMLKAAYPKAKWDTSRFNASLPSKSGKLWKKLIRGQRKG
ncbi:hypothetical protein KS4_14440 [Poriferisphaera corsica]|uniref:Uncharacterized protein n=1 Tax=Poriferisphaera corsica TaxID=2528020 RepID=A0A517YT55_9BACT|nr:hypothetical protein [Poriferisphaera corsica]QDU33398.1 hypothetical protein KS4_14440 [Poriferisphaera corsica]